MKTYSPFAAVHFGLWLTLTVGPAVYVQRANAQAAPPLVDTNSAEWATYQNDALFDQLSGAARTRAEMKFGTKPPRGPKVNPTGSGQESSGGALALASTSISPVPNPLVNDPTTDTTSRDTQSETALALGAGSNVVCAFNDSGQSASGKYTGFSQSSNSAVSWVDKGSLPISTNGDLGDPVLAASAKTGTILLSTLSYYSSEKILIFRSTDNGLSFLGPTNGAPGFTSTNGDQDKEWITVDNYPGTGFGNVYMFWRNFGSPGGMTLTKSTDDGLTWGPSGGTVLASGGQGAQVVVGPDHAVYCFWYDSSSSPDRISMRKSTDFGASFGPTVTVTTFISTGVNGDLGLGGFRSSTFPQVLVNPVSSNLYIVYPDATAVTGGDRGNIYFRQSTNGGTNWSAAVKVNDDSTTRAQFQPAIAVRPDGNGLALCWYDRRRDPSDALIERWGVTAPISGSTVTFGPNFRISPQFPAVFGVDPAINATYMGDYDMMAADTNVFYTTWGDNRDPSFAVPTRNQANVRSATFTMAGPGPVVDTDSVILSGGNGNGLIDPNECNDLKVAVRNNGTGTATNISATLSTSTPGVSIVQSNATYSDLAPGAAATNTTAYKISTDPSYVCGTPVNLTLTVSYGATVNPSSFVISSPSYFVTPSAGAAIVPGTGDAGNHGDDVTTPISLPFSYTFYGQTFTNARVSANGNLQFSSANSDYANTCLPVATFANTIFPFWDDLRTDGTNGPAQGIYTNVSGIAPNRSFNIEWRASYYSGASNGNTVNFEIRLYEGQQRFDLIYGVLNGNGSSATVGAQKDTGSSFTQFECNSGGLSNGLQLSFQGIVCPDGGGQCGGPVADFNASPTNGLAPLTVFFTNLSTGATNYSWAFGDGNTSTATNPTNTYAGAGSYTVRLTAIGPTGTNTVTRANYIVATNVPPVIADFSASPTNGPTPLTVLFTNLSSGASGYSWNFGDGNSSSAANPTNTYSNAGSYTVTLTAVGAGGTNTATRANYIVATNGPPMIIAQPVSVTLQQKSNATFNVTAAGSLPLRYQWLKNGAGLVDGIKISGAATPSLTISNVANKDAGQYSVLVTNNYGSVLSSNATLTVSRGKGGPALTISALNPDGSSPGSQPGSDGKLFVLWPADPAWILEASTNLAPDTWVPVPDPPTQFGAQYAVPIQSSGPQRFYRLRYVGP